MSKRIHQMPAKPSDAPRGDPPSVDTIPRLQRLKPSPDESRRDRVAINCFQGLIAGMSPFTDPAELYGRTGTHGALLAKYAFDYADYFLAEREKRQPKPDTVEGCI